MNYINYIELYELVVHMNYPEFIANTKDSTKVPILRMYVVQEYSM